MADFKFLRVPNSDKWVILDPNRAKRPNVGKKLEAVCPFCVGREKTEEEMYRVGGVKYDTNWRVRVVTNKFPFASIHEIIIHSPDHHKNFEELPLGHIELVLQTYRARYNEYRQQGQVYIFHNRGLAAGESLPHPHSQLTVIPKNVKLDILPLDLGIYSLRSAKVESARHELKVHTAKYKINMSKLSALMPNKSMEEDSTNNEFVETGGFLIFSPMTSQWSDEIWVAPVRRDIYFGDINDHETRDLAFCLQRLIEIFDMRHGHEFPFNFYIYPGKNWYLRLIPRVKILGGFEVGTGVIVNTQDPKKTMAFVKEHFFEPDLYKIRIAQQVDYWM